MDRVAPPTSGVADGGGGTLQIPTPTSEGLFRLLMVGPWHWTSFPDGGAG